MRENRSFWILPDFVLTDIEVADIIATIFKEERNDDLFNQ